MRFITSSLATAAILCSAPSSAAPLPSADTTIVNDNVKKPRLQIGGYGEAVYSYNFYSDAWNRYKTPETINATKNDHHGRVDLPHVVIYLGYDFGKGWSMGTEIEFEHGGTESAIEMEDDEGGEYESEIERGGEVALEQFWLQKTFNKAINLRIGHMIVPVGGTNSHHMPNEFFGVYRPAGDNTIIPCTWHETGVSIFGNAGPWRYEAMLVPGLDSDRFGREGWAADAAGSPYEFKIANAMAGVVRIDNRSVKGLRMSLSGYIGNTFSNTLSQPNANWEDVKGTLSIGAFDFAYNDHDIIARGGLIYGHLTNSDRITVYNKKLRTESPSPKTNVASDAISAGVEVGYNIFSRIHSAHTAGQRMYVFGRWDYYDSMFKTAGGVLKYDWCGRNRLAAGINWYPIKQIVVKGEYSVGIMRKPYNNEPSISLGVAYAGFFTR